MDGYILWPSHSDRPKQPPIYFQHTIYLTCLPLKPIHQTSLSPLLWKRNGHRMARSELTSGSGWATEAVPKPRRLSFGSCLLRCPALSLMWAVFFFFCLALLSPPPLPLSLVIRKRRRKAAIQKCNNNATPRTTAEICLCAKLDTAPLFEGAAPFVCTLSYYEVQLSK